MTRRNLAFAVMFIAVACATAVLQAAPVFYVSEQTAGAAPGMLNRTGANSVLPGASGMLNVWSNSDIRLSGVSLDLLATGNGMRFVAPLTVNGQGSAWAFLDGPQSVSDTLVTRIGGGAVPNSSGTGIGAGSPAGPDFLLGSVGYVASMIPGASSSLSLRIAGNEIVDWDGAYPQLRFGSPNAAPLTGDQVGMSGAVGTISVVIPEPATLSLVGLAIVGLLGLARRRK